MPTNSAYLGVSNKRPCLKATWKVKTNTGGLLAFHPHTCGVANPCPHKHIYYTHQIHTHSHIHIHTHTNRKHEISSFPSLYTCIHVYLYCVCIIYNMCESFRKALASLALVQYLVLKGTAMLQPQFWCTIWSREPTCTLDHLQFDPEVREYAHTPALAPFAIMVKELIHLAPTWVVIEVWEYTCTLALTVVCYLQ